MNGDDTFPEVMWSHSFRPQFSRGATFFFKHHFTFSFVISLDFSFNRAVAAKYEALTQFRITRKSAIQLCHRFLSDKTPQEKKNFIYLLKWPLFEWVEAFPPSLAFDEMMRKDVEWWWIVCSIAFYWKQWPQYTELSIIQVDKYEKQN